MGIFLIVFVVNQDVNSRVIRNIFYHVNEDYIYNFIRTFYQDLILNYIIPKEVII